MNNFFNKIYIFLRDKLLETIFIFVSEKLKFNLIYKYSYWRANRTQSLSGYGSSLKATENLRRVLIKFIQNYKIKKIFDVPCGDFYWMKEVNLENLEYYGADIVNELIANNKKKYSRYNVNFFYFDLINQIPKQYDMIINRDCLVHFKTSEIIQVLKNIKKSESVFFASTTYPELKKNFSSNRPDNWREINLSIEPYNLGKPFALLNDNDEKKKENLKFLGIWKIQNIK